MDHHRLEEVHRIIFIMRATKMCILATRSVCRSSATKTRSTMKTISGTCVIEISLELVFLLWFQDQVLWLVEEACQSRANMRKREAHMDSMHTSLKSYALWIDLSLALKKIDWIITVAKRNCQATVATTAHHMKIRKETWCTTTQLYPSTRKAVACPKLGREF